MSEVTFKTGEIPICPFCELKHVTDAKQQSEGSRKKRLTQIQKELSKITGTPLKSYEQIRKIEHKLEDFQSYLRSERHKTEDSGNPIHFTDCEKRFPIVRAKLNRCIKQTEKKPGAFIKFNPYAVCRSKIKCPP